MLPSAVMRSVVSAGQKQSGVLVRARLRRAELRQRRSCATVLFVLLIFGSAFLWAQATSAQSQTPADNPASETRGSSLQPASNSTEIDVEKLKAVVADQQKRIEQLERMLDDQRKLIQEALHPSTTTARARVDSSGAVNLQPVSSSNAKPEAQPAIAEPIGKNQDTSDQQASPLTLRIGKVSVTPYGFLELTTIIRSRDVGSGLSTN